MSSYPPPIRNPVDSSRRGVQRTSLSSPLPTDPASAIDATTTRGHVGGGERDQSGSATEGELPPYRPRLSPLVPP